MACRTNKIEYPTRDAALAEQHTLVYHNHVRHNDHKSALLNVYPCPHCNAWHLGHLPQSPTVYHFDTMPRLARALTPTKRKLPKLWRRQLTGSLLQRVIAHQEKQPMVWFTWQPDWDLTTMPHPGLFLSGVVPHLRDGFVRIGCPASVAQLRWSDYLTANHTMRFHRDEVAKHGNPSEWLATPTTVPPSAVRSVDVFYRGAWVPADTVYEDDFTRWLAP
jgi:hypothetical protein